MREHPRFSVTRRMRFSWPSALSCSHMAFSPTVDIPGLRIRASVPPAPPLLPFSRGAVLPPHLRPSPTPTVPLGDRKPHGPPYRLCGGRGLGGLEWGGGIVRRKSLLVAPGSRVPSRRCPPDWASDGQSFQLLQAGRPAVSRASRLQKVSVPGMGPDLAAYLGSVFTVLPRGLQAAWGRG